MPILRKFAITNLRNISAAELSPSPGFNLFCGTNGSGKTSVLEAIHLLALGRSFRSHVQKPVIKEGEASTVVYGETDDAQNFGVQKSARGPQLIHIDGKKSDSLATLTRCLPLQLINSETFRILEGAPKERRQFLDWGVFHVEQPFFTYWRQAKVALLNRNNLLKADAAVSEIEPWSNELCRNSLHIDSFRSTYSQNLALELEPLVSMLFGDQFSSKFEFRYVRGWNDESDLLDQLKGGLAKDRKYGFTTAGPHKADLSFQFGSFSAADVLSRGQLKLLVCALKIAQSKLLYRASGKHCIFLVDDLAAELDASNRRKICSLLAELQDQVFFTAIEEDDLLRHMAFPSLADQEQCKVFHVKHGIIESITPPYT